MDLKRVVITGLGTINPLGHNVPELWDNLLKGVSGAGPITRFDASKFRTQFACEVKNYEPTEYFDKKEVRKMDLYTQFGIIAAREALKDSGLDLETANKKRIGTSVRFLAIPTSPPIYLPGFSTRGRIFSSFFRSIKISSRRAFGPRLLGWQTPRQSRHAPPAYKLFLPRVKHCAAVLQFPAVSPRCPGKARNP